MKFYLSVRWYADGDLCCLQTAVIASWNSEKGRVEKAREARNRFLEAQNGEAQLRAISEGASGEAAEVEDANGTGLWSVDRQRQEVQRRAALAAEITESMTSEIAHCNETVETLITSCLEEKIFSAVDAGRRELQQHLAEELGVSGNTHALTFGTVKGELPCPVSSQMTVCPCMCISFCVFFSLLRGGFLLQPWDACRWGVHRLDAVHIGRVTSHRLLWRRVGKLPERRSRVDSIGVPFAY